MTGLAPIIRPVENVLVCFETVCCSVCHVHFALDQQFFKRRRQDRLVWYCPNGHTQYFVGETEVEKLKKQLQSAEESRQWALKRLETANRYEEVAKRCAAAARGQVTKLKNRVKNGVCPCCNRSFTNLHKHMKSKHPDFGGEKK